MVTQAAASVERQLRALVCWRHARSSSPRDCARSLQRQLRAAGLGFRCLLEETRQQLAIVRLARGDDLARVRTALGYADRRTAARAVRRWFVDS